MNHHLRSQHRAVLLREEAESGRPGNVAATTSTSTISSVEVPAMSGRGFFEEQRTIASQQTRPVTATQPTLEQFGGFHSRAVSKQQANKITRLIGQLIAVGGASFNMIDGEPFKQLMAAVSPQYHLPSRYTFSRRIIPSLYQSCVGVVKEELSKAAGQSVHFTTDLWSAPSGQHAFLSLTAHWWQPGVAHEATTSLAPGSSRMVGSASVDQQGYRSFLLHAEVMDENHTSENILHAIKRMVSHWVGAEAGTNVEVGFVVTDGAANMLKALRDGHIVGVRCAAHILHLVVKSSIPDGNNRIARVIDHCRRIAGHFHRSVNASHLLRQEQEKAGLPIHCLRQDVVTRWNSTLEMLERILEQQRAIHSLSSDQFIGIASPLGREDWTVISQTVAVLKPFRDATEHLSMSTASLGQVIPLFSHLGSKMDAFLENREVFQGGLHSDVAALVRKLKENLKLRLRDQMDNYPELMLACMCDPRIKGKLALKYNILTICRDNLIQRVLDWQHKSGMLSGGELQHDIDMSAPHSSSAGSDTSTRTQLSGAASFWEEALENLVGPTETPKESTASEMVKLYLCEPPLPPNVDPLSFWDQKKIVWPALSVVAQKLLSCPATSVQSERVFSITGNILNPQRSRMSPHLMEQMAFLKFNLPKLGYPALKFEG
ncbi:zinc finger BED domain-containing protein 4-like [Pelodytes ibericus]